MKARGHRKNVRLMWYASFLAVVLVPLSVMLAVYNFSLRAIDQQTRETNSAYLQLMVQAMESAVTDMDRMADMLTLNEEFRSLRYLSSDVTTKERYQLYDCSRRLLREAVPSLSSLRSAVYLKKGDWMLTTASYQTAERAYYGFFYGMQWDYETYLKLITSPHDDDYYPVVYGATPGILCIRSLPKANDSFDVNVISIISQQAILDALEKAKWNKEGAVCILDKENQVLLSSNESLIPPELLVRLQDGEAQVRHGGETYLCLSRTSSDSGLRYLYVASYKTIYREAVWLRNLCGVAMAVSVIGAAAMIVVMVRRNYSPVQRILTRLEPERGDAGENEYDRILNSIERGQSEQISLKTQLEEKRHLLGRELLERYLTGHLSQNARTYRMLESHGISLNRARWAVACLGAAEFYNESNENIAQNATDFLCGMLEKRMPGVTVYQTAEGLTRVLVLGFEAGQEELLRRALDEARQEMLDSFRMQVTVALSCADGDPGRLHELYQQADAALDYAQTREDGALVCYPDQPESQPDCFPMEQELLLLQAVREGRMDRAEAILDEAMARYAEQLSVAASQCLRFKLIATCMRIFTFADTLTTRDQWQGESAVRQLTATQDMAALDRTIREILKRICALVASRRTQGRENLSGQVCQLVAEHWQESELSVAWIAQKLEMHPSYVSRLFKEERGVGLLEYINRFRVDKACGLLAAGGTIGQVALQCGFASDASFIRVFKQYKGVTPGRFREENA